MMTTQKWLKLNMNAAFEAEMNSDHVQLSSLQFLYG